MVVYITKLSQDVPKGRLSESRQAWELLRIAARQAGVEELAGAADIKAAVSRGPHGKPYLPGGQLHFNISHSHGLCACAVEQSPVGLDVQWVRPVTEQAARRICSEHEQRMIEAAPDRDRAPIALWTCKEAYMKYTGLGFAQGIADTEFMHMGERPRLMAGGELGLCFRSKSIVLEDKECFITACKKGAFELNLKHMPNMPL